MNRLTIPGLLLALLLAGAASAAVLNVPGDHAQIHDAVQACAPGDTVLVAAGTYNDCTHPTEGPESTPACIIMKSGVTLIGDGPEATIVDAEGAGRGIFIESVENCRVENLQVRNAHAQIYGAGILARYVDSSVEITDVRVTNCTDGGIILIHESSPILRRVTMDHNVAKQGGGLAIEENSNPQVYDCSVDQNESPSGAGIFIRNGCAPVIDGCFITDNTITSNWGNGGGLSIQTSTLTLTNSTISGNTTLGNGGGLAILDNSSGLVENCLIYENDAAFTYSVGGGVAIQTSDPVLRNNVIAGNTASGFFAEGGGIDISFTPSPTIENCTIADNGVGDNGTAGGLSAQWGATPTVDRCIISGSTSGAGIICLSATPVVSCSNIFGNAAGDTLCGTDGSGNFSADPMFCGSAERPYNLQPGSPCAPGNHPDGECDGALIGALGTGCGTSAAPLPGVKGLTLGNHPNPFNPSTIIFFDLPRAGSAQLRIYDLAGRLIAQRSWDNLPQGRTEFQWNGLDQSGRALSSGIYLYRLDSGEYSLSRRMSLIR